MQEIYSKLILSNNAIETIETDTFGVDNVHDIDLSTNHLNRIPYNALNSIRNSLSRIDLSRNRIQSLDATNFDGLSNLSILILAHNRIETIEEAAFQGLHKLRYLDLSHNPVTTWDPQAFKVQNNQSTCQHFLGTRSFN